jgi:hypothetical protein
MPQKARNTAVLAMKKPFSFGWEKGLSGEYEILCRMREKPYFPPVFETAR